MDDRLRSRVETEAAAQLEWGHPTEAILATLLRLGATQSESESLLRRLVAERSHRRLSANKLKAAGATLLVLLGATSIIMNKIVVRYTWGPSATTARRSPPQEGVGPFEFVLAYLFGNGGFFIGVCAILVGLVALGHFLAGVLHERHRTDVDARDSL